MVARHFGEEVGWGGRMRLHCRHGGVFGGLEVGQDGRVEGCALVVVVLVEVEGGEGVGVSSGGWEALRLEEGVVRDAVSLRREDWRRLLEVAVRAAEIQTGLLLTVLREAGVAESV